MPIRYLSDFFDRSVRSFRLIHSAEVFPFVAAFAALIQSGIFVGAQGSALASYTVTGCTRTAEIVWPGENISSRILLLDINICCSCVAVLINRTRLRSRNYTPVIHPNSFSCSWILVNTYLPCDYHLSDDSAVASFLLTTHERYVYWILGGLDVALRSYCHRTCFCHNSGECSRCCIHYISASQNC